MTLNSQTVRAKKKNTMGPALNEHQAQTNRLNLQVSFGIEFEAWPTVVQLKGKP